MEKSKKTESSVLYRKYRPHKWNDVIGQDHIVSVLEGSIKLNKIAHAYLFSGSRGTGKTSTARIFAQALEVSENDIYEIDAASNRGIDDIREIREGVNVLPFESKYKVYIIDEVHMLTKEAFNALLKTLEEPPSHALFILATTETEKIPETVLSRCQVFSFRKPNREILKKHVSQIAKKEGYTLEAGSSDLISLLGDGSFRDTLGILQKVVSSAKSKDISVAEIENITGAPKGNIVNDFILALALSEKQKALSVIQIAKDSNLSMKVFVSLILEKLRIILLIKNAPDLVKVFKEQVSEDDWGLLEKISKDEKSKINSNTLLQILKAYEGIGKAYIESLPLEIAVIDLFS